MTGVWDDLDPSDVAAWPADLLSLVRLGLGSLSIAPVARLIAHELRSLARVERGETVNPREPIPEELLEGVTREDVRDVATFLHDFGALPLTHRRVFASLLIECMAILSMHMESHRDAPAAKLCPFCAGVLPVGPAS